MFFLLALVACGPDAPAGTAPAEPVALRLGYFPNVTHATAIAGVERGTFAAALGRDVAFTTATFNAGPSAVEALLSGAIDATYIGPNPALNAYVKSGGKAVRVIAGATSGGAFFVVDPSIGSAADLRGKTVASPQLGNTQDVALRAWLGEQGLETGLSGDGDVTILPQENAQSLESLRAGRIAGAWVPEPWATRLVLEGGGKVLVDERALWPDGRFVTTHLVVRTDYLEAHPATVEALLAGHVDAGAWVNAHPDEARTLVNGAIAKIAGKPLAPETIAGAWGNLAFTNDPVASSLRGSAEDAEKAGLLDLGGLDVGGIYALDPLDRVLASEGLPPVPR